MPYLSEVLADNPLHFWRLADAGGHRATDIGSTRGSMNSGSTDPYTWPYTGPNSDGGSRDAGIRLSTIELASLAASQWSIELLIWPFSYGAAYACGVGFGGYNIGAQLNFVGGVRSVTWRNLVGSILVGGGINIATERWHHLVLVNDASHLTAWVDAVQDGQIANLATDTPFQYGIAGEPNGPSNWAMGSNVAEFAFYRSALSPSRITAHFLAIDNLSGRPTWKGSTASDTSAILAAVTRTFPAAV